MSMQPIQYETDTVVSDVGGEKNTSDETSYVKLGHSHVHYLYHYTFVPRPHDGEPISIQLMYRT